MSKVLERVIFVQTVQYMNANNLFHPNHHGFRAQHSTVTAMLQMYDIWVEAINKGELVTAVMIDQSAAFDCVDHDLLLAKLRLYGWDESALAWTKDYLVNRVQSCSVDSFISAPLSVLAGVPQGSILGPLYYCIFTNDFPEVVHQPNCPAHQELDGPIIYNMQCIECGGITVYADDSTFTLSDKDSHAMSQKIDDKFRVMADYLTANKLKVNGDKTHLLVMCNKQRSRHQQIDVSLNVGNETITGSSTERLLDIQIQQDMKWNEYIRDNKGSLLNCLSQRLGGLKMISRVASFKSRLTVANGIFMSKLIYMIPLWSGCPDYLTNALQVCQNKAAKFVAGHTRQLSVKQRLKECGWRSVRQEMVYHTVLMVHKIIVFKQPLYLYKKLTADGDYPFRTRQAARSSLRRGSSFRTNLELCKQSFRWRGTGLYEKLPPKLREQSNMKTFKNELDLWVKKNVPI